MFNIFKKDKSPKQDNKTTENIKEKTIRDKFNEYCEENPNADECRVYDV